MAFGRAILVVSFILAAPACSNDPIQQPEMPPQAVESTSSTDGKADLPWVSGALADGWRDTMTCATAFGRGASDGAENLWRLPGIITQFLLDLGGEFLERERDLIMALSDTEARQRVLETAAEDVQNLRALLMHLRRAIPLLWSSLQNGPGWFSRLNRSEKVTFVCEVTGRIAFEILFMIAADKGLSKLASLARIRLVSGVQGQAMTLYQAGRLANSPDGVSSKSVKVCPGFVRPGRKIPIRISARLLPSKYTNALSNREATFETRTQQHRV